MLKYANCHFPRLLMFCSAIDFTSWCLWHHSALAHHACLKKKKKIAFPGLKEGGMVVTVYCSLSLWHPEQHHNVCILTFTPIRGRQKFHSTCLNTCLYVYLLTLLHSLVVTAKTTWRFKSS